MASFGRLSNSLIQGVNENTLALANLNFDFSLVTVQAPVEFQQVGLTLADRRRQNAETGSSHQTARKLGALFDSLVPSVPGVIAAYGKRASEIMQKPGANPSGTTEQHGPFAEFVGADATGIWAAATSGQSSIATHLLACMLARTFSDPPEAVSAWVELVHERKQEIMTYNTRSTLNMAEIAALNASSQQVTREELRVWDASARAWLQTADSSMKKEHVQLRLIINNLSIPVAAGKSLYASFITAWTQALLGLEGLIAGEPQSVTNGAILLAISAWHLYPDLLVFSSQTTSVTFNDRLMNPCGILTVGITNSADASSCKMGMYWSVALSHYRYYGHPAEAVSEVEDRLTMDELYLVTFGGLLKSWGEPRANYNMAAEWFVALWECARKARPAVPGPAWLDPLADAASRFVKAENQERKEFLSLVDFGYRRGAHFLVPKERSTGHLPWFGLRNPHIIISLCQSSSKKCAIEYLRQTAAACELNPHDTLITLKDSEQRGMFEQHDYYTALPIPGSPSSIVPEKVSSLAGDDSLTDSSEPIGSGPNHGKPTETLLNAIRHRSWRGTFPLQDTGPFDAALPFLMGWNQQSPTPLFRSKIERFKTKRGCIDKPLVHQGYDGTGIDYVTRCQATLPALTYFTTTARYFAGFIGEETKHFSLWISQEDLDAKEIARAIQNLGQGKGEPLIDLQASTSLLKSGTNRYLVWQYLGGADPRNSDKYIQSVLSLMRREISHWRETADALGNLALAHQVYKTLEGATISSAIVGQGIHNASWAMSKLGTSLSRSEIFSCIAMMETGTVNLNEEKLHNVMALASGNSIYILSEFVTDPAVEEPPAAIVRIVGNVGRSGISLLVAPAPPPLVRPLSDSYRAVAYANFDGKRENNFAGTSLHLSFTPHEFPLDYGTSGIIDHQVFFVESVVSVHDSGKWVADLDIIGAWAQG
ncbi:hypothetical protein PG987_000614 [Apiospora arundinis]